MREDAPPTVELVAASDDDRDFVARLSVEVFSRFGPYGSYLPEIMRSPRVATIVARSGGESVGFAMFAVESSARADLVAIATVPAWQSRGIGRRLIDEVERNLLAARRRRSGSLWLHLSVAVDNEVARKLFESRGFAPTPGEGGLYPAGQRSIGMRKRLRG